MDYRVSDFLYRDGSIYKIVFGFIKIKIKDITGGYREGVTLINFLSGAQNFSLELTEEEIEKFENSIT